MSLDDLFKDERIYLSDLIGKFEAFHSSNLSKQQKMAPLQLFFCHALEDEIACQEIEKHLTPLKREGLITWHDRAIQAGVEWKQEVEKRFHMADITLLLVSADLFVNCYELVQKSVERHLAKDTITTLIIIRSVDWQIPLLRVLSSLPVLPDQGKPVYSSQWYDANEAFNEVAQGVRSIAMKLISPPHPYRGTDRNILPVVKEF